MVEKEKRSVRVIDFMRRRYADPRVLVLLTITRTQEKKAAVIQSR